MKKTYSTKQAATKIGVGFRTLNRWLALELIRPVDGRSDGWRAHALAMDRCGHRQGPQGEAAQKPGPKGPQKRKGREQTRMAVYARVSTTNHGQDVTLQTRELQQFAEARGWTVVRRVR